MSNDHVPRLQIVVDDALVPLHEAGSQVVEAPHHGSELVEVDLLRGRRSQSWDPGQDLAALVVDAKRPGNPWHAGGLEVAQDPVPCVDLYALSQEEGEMTERISLDGRVAVVTGAGRGLGRAYVELLAERGARVVVNDLGADVSGSGKDPTIAEQVADLVRTRGGEAIANHSDVAAPEGGSDLIATTIEHFGRVDLLVNNAGICGSQLFEDATLDDFDHYWRVHVGGPVNTVKAAWPHMVAQRHGKIILTTSVSGLFGLRGQATYAAAKCAVVGLMRILAIEGAEHGILVNTISPAAYTRMHPAAGSRTPEAEGRRTMPVEAVAPAVVWLASDRCSETNSIYNVTAGAIQRIAIVMGPGFYDPHLTPESIAENSAQLESIEGFSEPGPFEPGT